MTEELNITLYQGEDFELEKVVRDDDGFGVDITGDTFRMSIRSPSRDTDPAVLEINSTTPTAEGSTIEIVTPEVIAATTVTGFTLASAGTTSAVGATGAGFQESKPKVTSADDDGNPETVSLVETDIAQVGDLATLAGTTSNDGDYRVSSVTDEDTVNLLVEDGKPADEAAAGMITVNRHGRFRVKITDTESEALDFEFGYYDIERVAASGEVTRLYEGIVTLDEEVTT